VFSDDFEADRSWVQPGTEVVIYSTGGWSSRIVTTRTIEKVGKRDITLTDWPHAKFRVSDLSEQGRERFHGNQIMPVGCERHQRMLAARALAEKKIAAHKAVEQWQSSRDSIERLDLAVIALTEYRAALATAIGADTDTDTDG
jgi:hypothetical protein